jgi:hypothetical protein
MSVVHLPALEARREVSHAGARARSPPFAASIVRLRHLGPNVSLFRSPKLLLTHT